LDSAEVPAGGLALFARMKRGILKRPSLIPFGLAYLLLIPLQSVRPGSIRAEYDIAQKLFLHGYLEKSQLAADRGYKRFKLADPQWASKFLLLEAESMLWRGMYDDSLRILSAQSTELDDNQSVKKFALEAISLTRLQQFSAADQKLSAAETICARETIESCGEIPRARGVLAIETGKFAEAKQFFIQSLDFARKHHDQWLEATALLNLGAASLRQEHFDEAAGWSRAAYAAAGALGGEDIEQVALGNLGWDYFKLGDTERSLESFLEAEKSATRLGDLLYQIKWLSIIGYVNQDSGNLSQASKSYGQTLALAKRIKSKEEVVNTLEDLAHISIDAGRLDAADDYLKQLPSLLKENSSRLDELDVMLEQGRIAAARRNGPLAESLFRAVEADPESQTSMRMGAEHLLAKLYEQQNKTDTADRMYKTALSTYESARAQLKNEDSKLPFLANATHIYDDYIHFLVNQGKTDAALATADRSRAQTLAQGLGLDTGKLSLTPAAMHPNSIAQRTGSTLLFYWLGDEQSYLWAITPGKTKLFPLPAKSEISRMVEHYRRTLMGPNDAVDISNADGAALYTTLVAPAQDLIRPGSTVAILGDGALSQLNFETVIVPAPKPHYWIEDATLISAPSLYMLASAGSNENAGQKLLLLGDAVSPALDYPELPKAAFEMKQIEKHFTQENETVFARGQATAGAYLSSAPQQYAYIHFVAHGVSSRTDPLDSAIILSRTTAGDESFKLYSREVLQHPIHARLVTISACYGSGARAFAGEGLVGLSWAFLHAGAHNVIAALWEVSDESTPRLMDSLYQGLEDGLPPSAALRQAKLSLLHSQGSFRKPFFWAPFQIYTGL